MTEIFIAVCFLCFLGAGLAATVLRRQEAVSFFENRALAAIPVCSAKSVKDGSYAAQMEAYLDDHAALRATLLRLNVHLDLLLHRPVVNGIVITPERLLTVRYLETVDERELFAQSEVMADHLVRVSDAAAEYGGYFCYVAVPCQYAYFEDDYPWYLYNRSEFSRLSVFLLSQALEERGVNFLDVRAAFDRVGRPEEYGSNVDNHYTMAGAFETYRLILEKVKADTGLDFPILGPEDIYVEPLPNDFLGSRERRLLNVVTRNETLFAVYPRREVPFTRTDNGFASLPFVYAAPTAREELVTYDFYMGGNIANTVIDTHREELPTILIYGDSFTNAVECVAYLSFDEMHALDLRYYQEKSLEDYIRELQPEIVVCIRDFEALLSPYGNGAVD